VEVSATVIGPEKEKRHINRKGRSRIIPVCRQRDSTYIEKPKDSTKRLRNDKQFRHVLGYKINIQKSAAFLNIHNKFAEKKS
jgi:hypothetical protein